MRIAVIGGGPGGLYFAYLWKRRHLDADIDLFEQNAAGATWGFGVVFSEQALEFLRTDDSDTVDAIAPRMESWRNITLNLRGGSVEIDGVGFSSIGRLDLLGILQARASSVGVALRYDTLIASVDQLAGYDLIVGADGLNSLVRRSFEAISAPRCPIPPTSSPGTAPQNGSRRCRRPLLKPGSDRSTRITIDTRPA